MKDRRRRLMMSMDKKNTNELGQFGGGRDHERYER
jgi:hypothetical protein